MMIVYESCIYESPDAMTGAAKNAGYVYIRRTSVNGNAVIPSGNHRVVYVDSSTVRYVYAIRIGTITRCSHV